MTTPFYGLQIIQRSLRLLLWIKLQNAIRPKGDCVETTDVICDTFFGSEGESPTNILLYQGETAFPILYRSPIALRRASLEKISAMELAQHFVTCFTEVTCPDREVRSSPEIAWTLEDVTVRILPPGLLQFEVGYRDLAGWLQTLMQFPRLPEAIGFISVPPPNPSQLWVAHHAHARCCSLLRLAHDRGLITLDLPTPRPETWHILQPDPIPWLTSPEPSPQFQLNHPMEQSLMGQLVKVVDELAILFCETSPFPGLVWQRRAIDLGQSFQAFHRHCALWGQSDNLALVQARLGLLRVTQTILQLLLQGILGSVAPVEL